MLMSMWTSGPIHIDDGNNLPGIGVLVPGSDARLT